MTLSLLFAALGPAGAVGGCAEGRVWLNSCGLGLLAAQRLSHRSANAMERRFHIKIEFKLPLGTCSVNFFKHDILHSVGASLRADTKRH